MPGMQTCKRVSGMVKGEQMILFFITILGIVILGTFSLLSIAKDSEDD